ncbi:MAG TPA: glycolate oxidase subunit GlcE [Devosia sp.]|nr:glycolate oxidase subunit GlcE [Devosia sp.]
MTPKSEAELAQMIADAKSPLEIIGGGSRSGLGNAVTGAPLHLGALSGITLYDPDALTLIAQAGTPLAKVEAALDEQNQMLAFEPLSHAPMLGNKDNPTIGGMVAVNASGPRRIKAGACRDSLIGVRFVNGSGHIIKNGGRVMKNVTGYDLVKLMAGSHGTLGVITEVAFKVLPKPETTATLRFEMGLEEGLAKLRAAMGSPYDVSGAAYRDGAALLRIEGLGESVKYRAEKLGGEIVKDNTIWKDIADMPALAGASNIWRLSVKPGDAFAIAGTLHSAGFETPVFDWSGGLIWVTGEQTDTPRQIISRFGGHATCIKGDFDTFHPETTPLAKISAGLRSKFDPRTILNPGRMN